MANWTVAGTNITGPSSVTLLTYESVWRYIQVSNLDGINWMAREFDDRTWPTGPGLLAYENNQTITPLIRTVLNPPGTATNDVASGHAYYFRIPVVITNDLTGYTITASAYVDDGAVFYVNGSEVQRLRIAEDVLVTNLSFTTGQPPGGDATAPDVFTLPASLFLPGTNLLAVEVHQNQPNSSDITFGLQLTAELQGTASAAATPGAPNSGTTLLPPFPTLWLNELQAENSSGPTDNAGEHDPWIELFNSGTNIANLGGCHLSDNLTNRFQFFIPNNGRYIIPPGGYLLVWADNEDGQNSADCTDLHVSFALNKGGEAIVLSAPDGTLVDAVTFGLQTSDVSQGRFPDGAKEFVSMTLPTPRAPNRLSNT
ncbi:MAG: lamin tail domain-containing protein, partial [Verrucomicrobiota bacterium]|nr:lamin tail domain-containing protein [Verrucomicrobiota bacterium]